MWYDIEDDIDCDSDEVCALWAEDMSTDYEEELDDPCRLKNNEPCSINDDCFLRDCDSESNHYYYQCNTSATVIDRTYGEFREEFYDAWAMLLRAELRPPLHRQAHYRDWRW